MMFKELVDEKRRRPKDVRAIIVEAIDSCITTEKWRALHEILRPGFEFSREWVKNRPTNALKEELHKIEWVRAGVVDLYVATSESDDLEGQRFNAVAELAGEYLDRYIEIFNNEINKRSEEKE